MSPPTVRVRIHRASMVLRSRETRQASGGGGGQARRWGRPKWPTAQAPQNLGAPDRGETVVHVYLQPARVWRERLLNLCTSLVLSRSLGRSAQPHPQSSAMHARAASTHLPPRRQVEDCSSAAISHRPSSSSAPFPQVPNVCQTDQAPVLLLPGTFVCLPFALDWLHLRSREQTIR